MLINLPETDPTASSGDSTPDAQGGMRQGALGFTRQHIQTDRVRSLFLAEDIILFKLREYPRDVLQRKYQNYDIRLASRACGACYIDRTCGALLGIVSVLVPFIRARTPSPSTILGSITRGAQYVVRLLDKLSLPQFIGWAGLALIGAPIIAGGHLHLLSRLASRAIGVDGTNYIQHLLDIACSLRQYRKHACSQQPRLQDLMTADLVVVLAPFPDLFTHPCMGWVNCWYHTLRDWRRWHAAAYAYVELERIGALRHDATDRGYRPVGVYEFDMLEKSVPGELGWKFAPREVW
ncbi:hypothetical protein B0T25DRAFT_309592 [Lasiosphaeria hispida]|uniref:Uncharacterized protein n=1 Tax=Lasiosphaeria hispida TaxID=260671 RepID=A0AAJ0H9F9_9PEZI|nr:hypothetical protein B0T25DRAFT_309592 [Lasiosphaeria hispida]